MRKMKIQIIKTTIQAGYRKKQKHLTHLTNNIKKIIMSKKICKNYIIKKKYKNNSDSEAKLSALLPLGCSAII